jgi:uncharacterized protein (DUF924 family)
MSVPMTAPTPQAQAVLDLWFADGLQAGWPSSNQQALWFGGGAEQDQRIAAQFGELVEEARLGGLTEWEAEPLGRLALVILLDQFSRNVHRGSALAFAGDARAQKLVLQALALDIDASLPLVGRMFLYMPLMHAEDLAPQQECLRRFQQLHADAPPAVQSRLQGSVESAEQHLAIIQRFGRFPHRNAALGRASTEAETEFLKNGPRFGQ